MILARELHREPDSSWQCSRRAASMWVRQEYICKELLKHRARGAAILLISTELRREILTLSDKIAVMLAAKSWR